MASDFNMEQEIAKLQQLFGHVDIPAMLQFIGVKDSAGYKRKVQDSGKGNGPVG